MHRARRGPGARHGPGAELLTAGKDVSVATADVASVAAQHATALEPHEVAPMLPYFDDLAVAVPALRVLVLHRYSIADLQFGQVSCSGVAVLLDTLLSMGGDGFRLVSRRLPFSREVPPVGWQHVPDRMAVEYLRGAASVRSWRVAVLQDSLCPQFAIQLPLLRVPTPSDEFFRHLDGGFRPAVGLRVSW